MSIRFVTAWDGYYAGQIVSGLGGTEEARLVGLGFAVTDLDGPGNTPSVVTIKTLEEETTIAAAATTDTTITMPAGAIILAVSARVTAEIPTATTFTVGDSGSATRFSTAAIAVAVDSTDKGTKAGAYYNAAELAVRITPNGTPATATGKVRINIHYIDIVPPSF